jgi:hypothetical protein
MNVKEAVMIELTEEQGRQLNVPAPVAIDPRTKKTYILVPEALYVRFRAILVDDEGVLATGEMVDRMMAEYDANDPYLEEYQSYPRKDQK